MFLTWYIHLCWDRKYMGPVQLLEYHSISFAAVSTMSLVSSSSFIIVTFWHFVEPQEYARCCGMECYNNRYSIRWVDKDDDSLMSSSSMIHAILFAEDSPTNSSIWLYNQESVCGSSFNWWSSHDWMLISPVKRFGTPLPARKLVVAGTLHLQHVRHKHKTTFQILVPVGPMDHFRLCMGPIWICWIQICCCTTALCRIAIAFQKSKLCHMLLHVSSYLWLKTLIQNNSYPSWHLLYPMYYLYCIFMLCLAFSWPFDACIVIPWISLALFIPSAFVCTLKRPVWCAARAGGYVVPSCM